MPTLDPTKPHTFDFPGDLIGVAVIGHDAHPVTGIPVDSEPRDGDFNVPVEVAGQLATFTPPPEYPPGRWHVWYRAFARGEQLTERIGSYLKEE